ncbi:MAG: YwqG family protein [Planctomycetota bacterium]
MSKLNNAATTPEEFNELAKVIDDLSNIANMRAYAEWLASNGMSERAETLTAVLDAWESGEEDLPSSEDDLIWQNTCGITVLHMLRRGEMDDHATALLAMARPSLVVGQVAAVDPVPVGASKFGGSPDLPPDTEWPKYNELPMVFVGQIAMNDLKGTLVSRELPASGWLSFFVYDNPVEGEVAAFGEPAGCAVLHFPEGTKLERRQSPEPGDAFFVATECELEFTETLDFPYLSDDGIGGDRASKLGFDPDDEYEELLEELLPNREEVTHLMGWSHPNCAGDDPVDPDHRHLLSVASQEASDFCWSDAHTLYFSVPETDFKSHKFDNASAIDG